MFNEKTKEEVYQGRKEAKKARQGKSKQTQPDPTNIKKQELGKALEHLVSNEKLDNKSIMIFLSSIR
jgi:hypothetical protein